MEEGKGMGNGNSPPKSPSPYTSPGHQIFGPGPGPGSGRRGRQTFWKSFRQSMRKYTGCFGIRPKDAGRVKPIKPAESPGCCSLTDSEEHDENLKAFILHCRNSS